jgi:hypothetical protein
MPPLDLPPMFGVLRTGDVIQAGFQHRMVSSFFRRLVFWTSFCRFVFYRWLIQLLARR